MIGFICVIVLVQEQLWRIHRPQNKDQAHYYWYYQGKGTKCHHEMPHCVAQPLPTVYYMIATVSLLPLLLLLLLQRGHWSVQNMLTWDGWKQKEEEKSRVWNALKVDVCLAWQNPTCAKHVHSRWLQSCWLTWADAVQTPDQSHLIWEREMPGSLKSKPRLDLIHTVY